MRATTSPDVTAFGSRLRRLIERLDREVQVIYRAAGHRFEPRWFAVFDALRTDGPLTVGELSQHLGISHAAVSQVRTALQAEGLIRGAGDPKDGRRQVLRLTGRGRRTAARLAPLWASIATAVGGLLAEHAPHLPTQLDALERALDERGLAARVNTTLDPESLDDD